MPAKQQSRSEPQTSAQQTDLRARDRWTPPYIKSTTKWHLLCVCCAVCFIYKLPSNTHMCSTLTDYCLLAANIAHILVHTRRVGLAMSVDQKKVDSGTNSPNDLNEWKCARRRRQRRDDGARCFLGRAPHIYIFSTFPSCWNRKYLYIYMRISDSGKDARTCNCGLNERNANFMA